MKNTNPTYFVMWLSLFEILWMVGHGATAKTCNGTGYLRSGPNSGTTWLENCAYYCRGDKQYYDFTDLTWSEMKGASDDIRRASDAGLCDDASDLVYSNNTNGCYYAPRCGCSDLSKVEYHVNYALFEQECTSATCETSSAYATPTYNGRSVQTNSNPYHWDEFECPTPKYCNDSYDHTPEAIYRIAGGKGWFKKSGDDCTTYCYCDFDGEKHCEEGYDAIQNSKNIDLVDRFRDSCRSSLGTCLEDSSQWVEGSCRGCPKCSCGTNAGSYDTYWTVEVEDTFDDLFGGYSAISRAAGLNADYICYNCSCYNYTATDANGDKSNYDAVRCRGLSQYVEGYGECPPDASSVTKCYQSDDLVFNLVNADEEECTASYQGAYCGWEYTVDHNPDHDTNDDDPERGCANALMCDAMGVEDGECVYYNTIIDTNALVSQCDNYVAWESSINDTNYMSCCNGNLCNDYDIDTTKCSHSEILEKFWNSFYECNIRASYGVFHCPEEDSENKDTDCKQLIAFGETYYGCFCDSYSIIYDGLSKANKKYAEDTTEQFWSGLNHWLKAFGCKTKEFGCNYKTGSITKDGAKAISTFVTNAVVFIAVLVLFLF